VSDQTYDDPLRQDVPCPKCEEVEAVVLRAMVWLGVRYLHGHCRACGHVWVEPADAQAES
jgi:hypothetical protein